MLLKKDPMDVVEDTLRARSWKYDRVSKESIMTGFLTPVGPFFLLVRHDPNRETLIFFYHRGRKTVDAMEDLATGQLPFLRIHTKTGYSAEQVALACEFLMEENYRLVLGGFERDQSDGEIRFRITLPYRDSPPTIAQIGWCIEMGCASSVHGMEQLLNRLEQPARMEI